MSERVHVVMGTCGAYSDRTEWPVRAFRTQRRAETFALACKVRSDELLKKWRAELGYVWGETNGANELDPNMQMFDDGPDYFVVADVPMDDEISP